MTGEWMARYGKEKDGRPMTEILSAADYRRLLEAARAAVAALDEMARPPATGADPLSPSERAVVRRQAQIVVDCWNTLVPALHAGDPVAVAFQLGRISTEQGYPLSDLRGDWSEISPAFAHAEAVFGEQFRRLQNNLRVANREDERHRLAELLASLADEFPPLGSESRPTPNPG